MNTRLILFCLLPLCGSLPGAGSEFRVDADYPGGNIRVLRQDGNTFILAPDLRDTQGWWFHFNFRLRGPAEQPVTIAFEEKNPIGVRGPAVSIDSGRTWSWMGKDAVKKSQAGSKTRWSFEAVVPEGAAEARFAFAPAYLESHLREWLDAHRANPALQVTELCRSRKGRSVELLRAGCLDLARARGVVLLTSRHHACESMATYVLEGLLTAVLADDELGRRWREHWQIVALPFADKDGVEDGDQGKNRAPHDHNRDYNTVPLYPEVLAWMKLGQSLKQRVVFSLDLHCPYISGTWNDRAYIVGSASLDAAAREETFARVLEAVRRGSIPFPAADCYLPAGIAWNQPGNYAAGRSSGAWARDTFEAARFTGSMEIAYADALGVEVNADSARALGRDLAHAILENVEYDAAFVELAVPDRVGAGEVFPATITMRNTGVATWHGSPIRLRSINPRTNRVWGTDYILIAQGAEVQPGAEYTFRSHLKAPSVPGVASFQWQACKDAALWFGQATPARTINVVARPVDTQVPAPAPTRTSETNALLNFADFEYAGSFKPPKIVQDARGAFSESGLALRPRPGGRDRLLMNYTHPKQVLFEVEIPQLVKIENGQHSGLNTAAVRKVWGSLKLTSPGEDAIFPNGGFVWNENTRTLIWTWYHGYKTGEAPPVLGATRLPDDGQPASFGPWRVSVPGGLYKSYWGGVTALPRPFADQYTGGKTLALGFGGYYSICAAASRGPALGAIPQPDPQQTFVPVTPLLCYPHNSPAARDGDYFNANCGFWSEQPRDPKHGTWSYDDWCRAGVFIETSTGQAYLAFVRLGTGRLGYDFGAITSASSSEYWYFYDPKDLGEAAIGQQQPWKITPTSRVKVTYPLGRSVTGACFDANTRLLYLCLSWAYPEGRENYPIIHAYRVK